MPLDLNKIQESPHLLDILLQMEDVLDSLDVYVFKNWYLGEVAEGPTVRRYWLDFTLRYPFDKMPDPKAALRLLKHGVRVDFWKAKLKGDKYIDAEAAHQEENQEELNQHPDTPPEANPSDPAKDPAKDTVWLVKISIPRRLIAQMSAEQMDFYDEEVDVEDVEDAKDTGIDDESAYMNDDDGTGQTTPGMEGMEGMPGEAPPGGAAPPPPQGGPAGGR